MIEDLSPPQQRGKWTLYVPKRHIIQSIETPKKAKISLRLELNFLLMKEWINFIQHLCSFVPFKSKHILRPRHYNKKFHVPLKIVKIRAQLSVDARMLKTSLSKLHDFCYSMIAHTSPFFLYHPSYYQIWIKVIICETDKITILNCELCPQSYLRGLS